MRPEVASAQVNCAAWGIEQPGANVPLLWQRSVPAVGARKARHGGDGVMAGDALGGGALHPHGDAAAEIAHEIEYVDGLVGLPLCTVPAEPLVPLGNVAQLGGVFGREL